jgi:uncharacterized FlaG/YvyC family protein
MSENQLSSVKGPDVDLAGWLNQTELTRPTQAEHKAPVQAASSANQPENAPGMGMEARPERAANPLSNVRLQFRIDEKTRDVTLLVLDKTTHKVLRTIPPEEMTKLEAGDLMELFR